MANPSQKARSAPTARLAKAAADSILLDRLAQRLLDCSPLALAFSGGLDSRFLAHSADRLASEGMQVRLLHIRGPHVPWAESAGALSWAKARGLRITLVSLNPLTVQEVRANGKSRCYHCKRFLFKILQEASASLGDFAGKKAVLCDGSHLDDQEARRPGLNALQELGVRSPLAEAGLNKQDIVRLAALTGLDRPEQYARPCLLTRFAYGLRPTPAALAALEAAENSLAAILADHAGPVPEFRLRFVAGPKEDPEYPVAVPASFHFSSFQTELHLGAKLPKALKSRLLAAVTGHQGLSAPRLRVLDKVSGHFDRA